MKFARVTPPNLNNVAEVESCDGTRGGNISSPNTGRQYRVLGDAAKPKEGVHKMAPAAMVYAHGDVTAANHISPDVAVTPSLRALSILAECDRPAPVVSSASGRRVCRVSDVKLKPATIHCSSYPHCQCDYDGQCYEEEDVINLRRVCTLAGRTDSGWERTQIPTAITP